MILDKVLLGMCILAAGLAALPTAGGYCYAQESELSPEVRRSVTILGHKEVLITAAQLRLVDIAEVRGKSIEDEEAVVALRKIVVGSSPAPGRTLTLDANQVVSQLKAAGVDLKSIGYVFPRRIEVRRASREVSELDVRSAIEKFLKLSERNVEVRSLSIPPDLQVSTGDVRFEAKQLSYKTPGKVYFEINALQEGERELDFKVEAMVDEWAEVPVARRPILKGNVVDPSDIMMARLNLANLPLDRVSSKAEISGLQLLEKVESGDIFRRSKLAQPIIISAGDKVTLRYRSKTLVATATAEALESGTMGQAIRLRNLSSKKIVFGTVLDENLVEVNP